MKASIIICYTNQEIVDRAIEYLDKQDNRNDFEIVAIDNRDNKFTSAAKALNYGASIAKGNILIFMHQDVMCEHTADISELVGYFNDLKGLVLLGVAGYSTSEKGVCSNITETNEHVVRYKKVISMPSEVETIDECIIAIRKQDFDKIKFDEDVCNNWHFYGVDLSYQVRLNGGKVYCVPVPICHLSKGNINKGFFKGLKLIIKKYKGILPSINSTCVQTRTNVFIAYVIVARKKISRFLNNLGLKK